MNRKRQVVFLSVLAVFYVGLILGGFGLHFWTVKMIYHLQGRGVAILAFMFPVGAEVFWALKEWRLLGFVNLYTLAVIGYGVLWLFMAWALTLIEEE